MYCRGEHAILKAGHTLTEGKIYNTAHKPINKQNKINYDIGNRVKEFTKKSFAIESN